MPRLQSVVAWAVLVFLITFVSALPVLITGMDLSHVTFETQIPAAIGVAILMTGYAPTFAALIVAWLVPGESGISPLLRPVLRWRVDARWYLLALVGPTVLLLVAVG